VDAISSPGCPRGEALLDDLQRRTFTYFRAEWNPANGLVKDNTRAAAPASITAVGLGLACYPIAVERGWLSREDAVAAVLQTVRFFWESEQGQAPGVTGYRGFYYHFLDMQTGCRAGLSELSTIDTTFLLAGALVAAQYFDRPIPSEAAIRELADALYRRCEWDWALNGSRAVSHGWSPESGFLPWRWQGYNEALLLYVLALGSPTHPIPADCYNAWLETYRWRSIYGYAHVFAGPLFIHQLSHCWLDLRGIQDPYMRARGLDYFENSRRATLVQREYCRRNPRGFRGYSANAWGITASDGPGRHSLLVDGRRREFFGYQARGVPWGLDDGTLSPWAVTASLPFAPGEVVEALEHIHAEYPEITSTLGFKCSFNPTFPEGERGWISEGYYGLDQGPIVLMIENHRTELVWRLMRRCPHVRLGLQRASFRGGWLG
jgi:hypothetical protein